MFRPFGPPCARFLPAGFPPFRGTNIAKSFIIVSNLLHLNSLYKIGRKRQVAVPSYFRAATAQMALISSAVSTAYSGPGTAKPFTRWPQA